MNNIYKRTIHLAQDLFLTTSPLFLLVLLLLFFGAESVTGFVVVTLGALTLLPGLLAFRLINISSNLSKNTFFVFLASFVLGLSVPLYPSLLIYYFRLDAVYLLYCQILLALLFLILNVLFVKGRSVEIKYTRTNTVLAATMILFLATALYKGSHEAGDAVFHITYIRNLMASVPLNPFEAHFPIEAINPSSGYSLWYLLLALVGRITGADAYVVWRSSIYFLSLLLPLGVFYFAKAILKKPKYAIWALITFCLYYLYKGYLNDSTTAAYPDRIARLIMIPVAVYVFQKILDSKERIKDNLYLFVTLVLIVGAIFSVHMFSWLFFFIFLLIFFLIDTLVRKRITKKTLLLILYTITGIILITLPALLLKMGSIYSYSANPDSAVWEKREKYLIYHNNGMISYSPEYLLSLGLLTTSVLFLAYYGIAHRNEKKVYWYYYSWLVILIPVAIMVVPPLTTIGYKLFSIIYIGRLLSFIPIFIILGRIFGPFLHKSRMEYLAIVLLFTLLFQVKTSVNHRPSEIEKVETVYRYIKEEIPENSTVLSNLWDSYYLAAYSNNYIVGTYSVHMTSNVDGEERISAIEVFLDPEGDSVTRKEIIDKYNVNYLLIRKKAPAKSGYKIYWNAPMALYSTESAAIFNSDDYYQKIYEDREFDFYKVVK